MFILFYKFLEVGILKGDKVEDIVKVKGKMMYFLLSVNVFRV